METLIQTIEQEAGDALRLAGEQPNGLAAENLLRAIQAGLLRFDSAQAERYALQESIAAGRQYIAALALADVS